MVSGIELIVPSGVHCTETSGPTKCGKYIEQLSKVELLSNAFLNHLFIKLPNIVSEVPRLQTECSLGDGILSRQALRNFTDIN